MVAVVHFIVPVDRDRDWFPELPSLSFQFMNAFLQLILEGFPQLLPVLALDVVEKRVRRRDFIQRLGDSFREGVQ